MRIQLRLNGVGCQLCFAAEVSDPLGTVELIQTSLQMIRTVRRNDQKAVNQ